jgi:PHD/YefM family antitoxin component YafN of YafNO toxin-antitoxin module
MLALFDKDTLCRSQVGKAYPSLQAKISFTYKYQYDIIRNRLYNYLSNKRNHMNAIQTESVSGFRDKYDAVLKKLSDGPVLLLQRSRLAAVLVSHEEWNRIAMRLKRLEDLELLMKAKEIKARVARGEEKTISHDELTRLMLEKRAAGDSTHVGA